MCILRSIFVCYIREFINFFVYYAGFGSTAGKVCQ